MNQVSLKTKIIILAAAVIMLYMPARAASPGGFEAKLLDAYSMSGDQEVYDSVWYNYLDGYDPVDSWSFFNADGTDLLTSDPGILRSATIKVGVAGSGNDAYPFLEIKGECPSAIVVNGCVLAVGDSVYLMDFTSSAPEHAICQVFKTEENASRLDLYVPMGNIGIDLLNELYTARFAFSCSVLYNGDNTVTLSSAGYSDEHYAFNWVYEGLLSAGYLDSTGNADPIVKLLILDTLDNNPDVPRVTYAAGALLPSVTAAPAGIAADMLYVEPTYAIIFTYYGDSGMLDGSPWFADEVINISAEKVVAGYTIVYYCQDENGDQLQPAGGGDTLQFTDIEGVIPPGKTVDVPTITVDGYENVKSVHTAISRILYEDGTEVNIPDRLWKYCTWVY